MSIGKAIRKILGKKLFLVVGKLYKAYFFNLKHFIETFPDIKPDSVFLDIGGGEGDPINYIMKKFPETNVIMLDIADEMGGFLDKKIKEKVKIYPNTSVKKYCEINQPKPNYILIMDVLHHISKVKRKEFFDDIKSLLNGNKCQIIIKDNEPGYFKTKLGYWADVYISGDKNTSLVSKDELINLMKSEFGNVKYYETNLFEINKPNYSFVFSVNN
ncbi:MAG: class I SAM-dependent methyltransferase [Ignavibacteriae bacterium]|nr:class I SAM-dependent methyltransferase [Ignavibacteriota bacterium]